MERSGNTILVTDGTSELGAALAQKLHGLGNVVVVAAGRDAAALARVAAGCPGIHPVVASDDLADVATRCRRIVADFPALNVLIDTAGLVRYGPLAAGADLAKAAALNAVNLLDPVAHVAALADHLAARGDGLIVNVGSVLAFVPLLAGALYSASKAALHSYTVSLRLALAGRVEVTELVTPTVRAQLSPEERRLGSFMLLDEFVDEAVELLTRAPVPPELVVERIAFLRQAEARGAFDHVLRALNTPAG